MATLASTWLTYYAWDDASGLTRVLHAASFSGALMGVLTVHELSHWVAAKLHRVDASPPYFIPLPLLSPFGTLGAVIRLRGFIANRRALLDIGASGPLGGLLVAIPLYAWGSAHSTVITATTGGSELGESLLVKLLDHFFSPTVPEGQDLLLHPVAFGAWGGMLVTMLNLLPVSQLDGGHVAYALFGSKQNDLAPTIHRALLVFFFLALGSYLVRDLRAGHGFSHFGDDVGNSTWWLFWFEMLAILGSLNTPARENGELPEGSLSVRTRATMLVALLAITYFARTADRPIVWAGWFVNLALLIALEVRGGVLKSHRLLDHPPTGAEPLNFARKVVAVVTLAAFLALFMPTPFSM